MSQARPDERQQAIETLRRIRSEVRARSAEDPASAVVHDIRGESAKTLTVSATEAKNRLGALLTELENGTSTIIIERHGLPRAVMLSAEEWAALIDARERLERHEAWERIWAIAAEIGARNTDLTQEEADAIADEIGDEAKRRVAQRLTRK